MPMVTIYRRLQLQLDGNSDVVDLDEHLLSLEWMRACCLGYCQEMKSAWMNDYNQSLFTRPRYVEYKERKDKRSHDWWIPEDLTRDPTAWRFSIERLISGSWRKQANAMMQAKKEETKWRNEILCGRKNGHYREKNHFNKSTGITKEKKGETYKLNLYYFSELVMF